MDEYPWLMHTAIDTTDCRGLAEFYRELLGFHYRPGHEPPADGPDDPEWLVLVDADGRRQLGFQRVEQLTPTTWPAHDVPMQMHLDLSVSSVDELVRQRDRAIALGARLVLDVDDNEAEDALYVLADPSGHPFCLLVR